MSTPLRVLVAGCGNMGASHARAYHKMPEFEIVGLVSRGPASRARAQPRARRPARVQRLLRGARRPPGPTSSASTPIRRRTGRTRARRSRPAATSSARSRWPRPSRRRSRSSTPRAAHNRKLVIGYILRVHPAWIRFIELARTLGKPLVMRMNLNQQSHGPTWTTHRNLMNSMSPIVDCGVHYVDVMCQMTGAKPVRVSAIGARLSDELKPGHVQLRAAAGDLRRRVGGLVRGRLGPDDERGGVLREGRHRAERLRVDRQGPQRDRRPRPRTTSTATRRPTASACITRALDGRQRVRQARRVHQHRGRARSPGAVRSRAGVLPAGHSAGRGSVGSHARRRQQPADRAGGG